MKLLLHNSNDIYNPDVLLLHENDMTHPISHYFISSSHNTYLEG